MGPAVFAAELAALLRLVHPARVDERRRRQHTRLDWPAFLARRTARREAALKLADRLLTGEACRPPTELSGAWAFRDRPEVVSHLLGELAGPRRPRVPERALGSHLAPAAALTAPDAANRPRPIAQHLRWLDAGQVAPPVGDSPRHQVAWGLCELAERFDAQRHFERRWYGGGTSYRPDLAQDRAAGELWAALSSANRWDALGPLAGLRRTAQRAAASVMASKGVAGARRDAAIQRLLEALPYKLIAAPEPTANAHELALRVLETAGDWPLDALNRLLVGSELPSFVAALQASDARDRSVRLYLGGLRTRPCRGLVMLGRLGAAPHSLRELLDVEVARHLLDLWRAGDIGETLSARSDRSQEQVLGRARGRLRAFLAAHPRALLADLLALPALAARTRSALGAFVTAWTRSELEGALEPSFDFERQITRRCAGDTPPLPRPIAIGPLPRTWVLFAVLRFGAEALAAWARTRHTGGGDKRLEKTLLLLREPPLSELADGPAAPARSSYDRLRAHIRLHLGRYLRELAPTLAALAGVDPSAPEPKARVLSILRETWSPGVPLPRGGTPRMLVQARLAVTQLERWDDDGDDRGPPGRGGGRD